MALGVLESSFRVVIPGTKRYEPVGVGAGLSLAVSGLEWAPLCIRLSRYVTCSEEELQWST